MQLLFVRKEIERKTVQDSSVLKDAVQVAVNNCLSKRKAKLWRKATAADYDDSVVSREEAHALKLAMERTTPWTPWQGR